MSCPSLYCSCFPPYSPVPCPAAPVHTHTHGGRGKPASYRRPRPLFHPPLDPLVYADRGQHTERRSHYNSTPHAKSSTGDEQLPATPPLSLPPKSPPPKNPKNPRKAAASKNRGGLKGEGPRRGGGGAGGEDQCVKTTVSRTLAVCVCGVVFLSGHLLGVGEASHGEVVAGCPAGLRGGGGRSGGRRRMRGDVRQEGGAHRRPEADSLLRIHTLPQEHPRCNCIPQNLFPFSSFPGSFFRWVIMAVVDGFLLYNVLKSNLGSFLDGVTKKKGFEILSGS